MDCVEHDVLSLYLFSPLNPYMVLSEKGSFVMKPTKGRLSPFLLLVLLFSYNLLTKQI